MTYFRWNDCPEPSIDPPDPEMPRCPECGEECDTIWMLDGSPLGCENCLDINAIDSEDYNYHCPVCGDECRTVFVLDSEEKGCEHCEGFEAFDAYDLIADIRGRFL